MAQKFKQGDKVEWNTPQGKTTGTVKKMLTSTCRSYSLGVTSTGSSGFHSPSGLRLRKGYPAACVAKPSSACMTEPVNQEWRSIAPLNSERAPRSR